MAFTILITDNLETYDASLGQALQDAGHTVLAVFSLAEAEQYLSTYHPDIFLGFLRLQGDWTWETILKLRRNHPHACFFLMTEALERNQTALLVNDIKPQAFLWLGQPPEELRKELLTRIQLQALSLKGKAGVSEPALPAAPAPVLDDTAGFENVLARSGEDTNFFLKTIGLNLINGLFAASQEGIMVLDAMGKIVLLNERAVRVLGAESSRICLGKEFTGFLEEKSREAFLKGGQLARLGQKSGYELEAVSFVKEMLVLEVQQIPFLDPLGKYLGSLLTLVDITERVKALRRLKARETDIQRLDQLKENFINQLSFHFRNPLTCLIQGSTLLSASESSQLGPLEKEIIQIIQEDSKQMCELLEELLDISRFEVGRIEVNKINFELKPLLTKVTGQYQTQAGKKGITVEERVNVGLCNVYADPDRIEQILGILMDNAIKMTPSDGKVTIDATVIQDDNHQWARICVSDTSAAIAAGERERLFKRVAQDTKTGKEDSSSGAANLGMVLSSYIIGLHRGKIWVEAEGEVGNRFYFTIPLFTYDFSFREILEHRLKEVTSQGLSLSLMLVTIKEGELVESKYGPVQTEFLYRWLEDILKANARGPDIVARYATGKAAAVFAQTDKKGAFIMQERMEKALQKFENPLAKRGEALHFIFAIGSYPEDGLTRQELVDLVEAELVRQKQQ